MRRSIILSNTNLSTSPFNFSQFMILDLYKKYPQFHQAGKLEFCSCLYYPIAQLELDLLENSSEEFDSIEFTILELIDIGIKEPKLIANILGITESYVKKLIRILEGYGHLKGDKLTDLGKKSIEDEVKYTEFLVRQSFQADPIFGDFITKEMIQPNAHLLTAKETNENIPHVVPDPIVEKELLDNLLKDIKPYKQGKSNVFHVNAKRIENVVDKKIRFAYAFLLKFERIEYPIVVMRCKVDRYTERAVDAFYWKPVAIPSTASHIFNNIEDEADQINVVKPERFTDLFVLKNDIINQLNFLMDKFRPFPDKVERFFRIDWRVNHEKIEYSLHGTVARLQIELDDVTEMDKKWLQSLLYYDVGFLHMPYVRFAGNHLYPGVVCYAETTNEAYKQFIREVQKAVFKRNENIEQIYKNKEDQINQLKKTKKIELGVLSE